MKVRIIKKINHQVVEDKLYESSLNLSYNDCPAFVSAEIGSNRKVFDFAYIGSSERPVTVSVPSVGDVSVGINSGRVIKADILGDANLNEDIRKQFIIRIKNHTSNNERVRDGLKLLSEVMIKTKQ